ncbi:MAG: adenosylcobinamide-GDP ribazoletransferase [Anaerolineales bacterium]
MNSFRLALGFLTIIPVRLASPQPGDLGRAAMWFPILGFFMGIVLAAAHLLFSLLFAPLLAAALTVALWALLTGGLHLDGLADCCDGLFAAAPPEKRLEIMHDPRLGAFGGIGLALFLMLKILALTSLPQVGTFFISPLTGPPSTFFPIGPLIVATTISRWLIVPVALQPSARPGGLGADFARGLTPPVIFIAALVPLMLLGAGLLGGWRILVSILTAHLVALLIIRLARARLGGTTGDVFGLTVELSELVILLVFAAQFP